MVKSVSDREQLAKVLSEREADYKAVSDALLAARTNLDDTEDRLAQTQRHLAAATGTNKKLATQLAENDAEWPFSIDWLNADIGKLQADIKRLKVEIADLELREEQAGNALRAAHLAVCRFDWRVAARDAIEHCVLLAKALHREQQARYTAASRANAQIGKLPNVVRPIDAGMAYWNPQSAICHEIRGLIATGVITESEHFLVGVKWRTH
jgi:chromosome segregation ATPase